MADSKSLISRRGAIATVIGGATIATAMARPHRGASGTDPLAAFKSAFTSPFSSLERGDDAAWNAEVGSALAVQGGAQLRITGVETFADYGRQQRNLIRPRAFLVNFELVDGSPLENDAIQTVTHPRHGSFNLSLKTVPELPAFVQAVFN